MGSRTGVLRTAGKEIRLAGRRRRLEILFGNTGEPVRNAWYQDGEKWYWFDGAGMMVSNTWKTGEDGKWYFLGADGAMVKNQWILWKGDLYRVTEDGSMFVGEMKLQTDEIGVLHL